MLTQNFFQATTVNELGEPVRESGHNDKFVLEKRRCKVETHTEMEPHNESWLIFHES